MSTYLAWGALWISLWLPASLGAQWIADPPATSPYFSFEEIGDGVWAVIAADSLSAICNGGIVDLGDATLVFDPFISPIPAEDLRATAEALTGRAVAYTVLSHWHNDHIRGTQSLPGSTVVGTERTRELILANEPPTIAWERENVARLAERERGRLEDAEDPDRQAEHRFWIDYYDGIGASHEILRTIPPNLTFQGRAVIHGSARSVELIEMAGHTESDLVLHVPDAGVAFLGDLLFIERHPYLGDGDPDALVETMARVEALGVSHVVPGHGPVGGVESLRTMSAYVGAVDDAATALVRHGTAPADVVAPTPPAPYDRWWYGRFYRPNVRFMMRRQEP